MNRRNFFSGLAALPFVKWLSNRCEYNPPSVVKYPVHTWGTDNKADGGSVGLEEYFEYDDDGKHVATWKYVSGPWVVSKPKS